VLLFLENFKGNIRARVQYLLYGAEAERDPQAVLTFGNVGTFVASGETISRKVKAYNYLATFKEDYETFKRKVGDVQAFIEELLNWLIPYDKKDYEVLVVGHRDTDNFHLHISVLNRNLQTEKALYIPKTKKEVKFYQTLRRYLSLKYGLEQGRPQLVKLPVGSLVGRKVLGKVKKAIAERFGELVKEGFIETRDEILEYLRDMGAEILDVWSKGVRISLEGKELTLIGGLFDEREFPKLKEELRREKKLGRVPECSREELESLRRELEFLSAERRKVVQERVKRDLEGSKRRKQKEATIRSLGIRGGNKKREEEPESFTQISSSFSRFPFRFVRRRYFGSPQQDSSASVCLKKPQSSQNLQWKRILMQEFLVLSTSGQVDSSRGLRVLRSPQPSTDTARTREVIEMEERYPFSSTEIDQAKMIDPETLLSYYEIPYEIVGGQYRIKAPWRNETDPSVYLRVNPATGHLIWKDFGGDQDGGSAIDFVMKASGVSFVEAVALLREIQGEPPLPEHPEQKLSSSFSRKTLPKGYTHRVLKVKDKVDHTALISLLKRKGIDPYRLPHWLKELHWEVSREDGYVGRFFGLAVQTEGKSWIVRTALDNRPKQVVREEGTHHSFAFCPARKGQRARKLAVVEGITDALSLWQYLKYRGKEKDWDIVVLGGVGTYQEFLESGLWQDYDELFLGVDLDDAGQKTLRATLKLLRDLNYAGSVIALDTSLREYGKDINEILRALSRKGVEKIKLRKVYDPTQRGKETDIIKPDFGIGR